MPKFYLHIHNGNGFTRDDEGSDVEDQAAARVIAITGIRSMVAEEALEGTIDLSGRIEIRDPDDQLLTVVPFTEAFELRNPR